MRDTLIAPIKLLQTASHQLPEALIALIARLAAATPFWKSGQNKIDGWDFWNVTDSTVFLFEYEYALPLISPTTAASLASIGEHILPMLLIFGLLTRIGAAGLLMMTFIIQTLVYPEAWSVHILWFAPLTYLLARGGGTLSLDYLLRIERPQ